jgi:hypothetical protein
MKHGLLCTLLFTLLFSLIIPLSFSAEVSWETLKTLDMDAKTKKAIIPDALKKAISSEVTLKGFMMPLDYESKEIVEFLFMPYVPSCMHVPPPPANQLILVKMKKGAKIKPSFYPIELVGKLSVEENVELESSYKMEGSSVKELKQYTPPTPAVPAGAHP